MKFKRVSVVVFIAVLLVAGMPHLTFAYRRSAGGGKLEKFTFEDALKAVAVPIVVLGLPMVVERYRHYDGASGVVFTPSEGEGMVMGIGYGNFALLGKDNWVVRPSVGVAGLFRIIEPGYWQDGFFRHYEYEFLDLMCLAGLMTRFGREQGVRVGAGLGYAFYQNSANLYLTICW